MTPVFAEETSANVPTVKPVMIHSHDGNMHGSAMVDTKDECDAQHEMGGQHSHMQGMMGGAEHEMMMKPNMLMLKTLNLSKEQQSKIQNISDELRHKNWSTQGLINDESSKLRDLYDADKLDTAAIGKEYQKIFDFKRQMIEAYLDTQNRIDEILTPEQRTKMKKIRHEMGSVNERM